MDKKQKDELWKSFTDWCDIIGPHPGWLIASENPCEIGCCEHSDDEKCSVLRKEAD